MIEMTGVEYLERAKGKNKFKAKRTRCGHNHWHASEREALRCDVLYLLQRGGVISQLKQQPRFVLQKGYDYEGKKIRRLCYYADFSYLEDGVKVIEDCKGYRTNVYKIKKKLVLPIIKKRGYRFIET